MQPLLILKQTIESPYDPGALLLNGPNIKFTSFEQMLSKTKNKEIEKRFYIQLEDKDKVRIRLTYTKTNKNIEIKMTDFNLIKNTSSDFEENMNSSEIIKKIEELEINYRVFPNCRSSIVREKCFLYYAITHNFFKTKELLFLNNLNYYLESILQELIHLPGLRGNPERNYKTTAVRDIFPGTFENYVASIIKNWQENKDKRLKKLCEYLKKLGLTWKVEAKQINDTQVELMVGRLPQKSSGKGCCKYWQM